MLYIKFHGWRRKSKAFSSLEKYFYLNSGIIFFMRLAEWTDRKDIIDIIVSRFENIPGTIWVVREKANKKKAISCLASYVFLKSYNREGAWISDNNMGMALCFRYNKKIFSLRELWCLLRFTLFYGSLGKIKDFIYRESYREKQRPPDGNYLYWWFFGVKKGGDKAGFEISREIIRYSEREKLPIYLETTIEKNMRVYERYGYELYHYWEEPDKDIRFWFMKREVK